MNDYDMMMMMLCDNITRIQKLARTQLSLTQCHDIQIKWWINKKNKKCIKC